MLLGGVTLVVGGLVVLWFRSVLLASWLCVNCVVVPSWMTCVLDFLGVCFWIDCGFVFGVCYIWLGLFVFC